MAVQLNDLYLVYPPISNQEAHWLQDIPEVRTMMRHSHLYMIGHRSQVYFTNHRQTMNGPGQHVLHFEIVREGISDVIEVTLPMSDLLPDYEGKLEVELGDKLIRVWPDPLPPPGTEPLAWYTPDTFLHAAWRGHFKKLFPIDLTPFTTFDLLYVGISKKDDSFSRLFDTGHLARASILTNETQRSPGSRLTDELTLFFFDIASLGIRVVDSIDPSTVGMDFRADPLKVLADAEKAFVSIMRPGYNKVVYHSYPQSTDGLWKSGLEGYSFAISEDITFVSPATTFAGSFLPTRGDSIAVTASTVEVFRSR